MLCHNHEFVDTIEMITKFVIFYLNILENQVLHINLKILDFIYSKKERWVLIELKSIDTNSLKFVFCLLFLQCLPKYYLMVIKDKKYSYLDKFNSGQTR